jgi:hypothetical protein
MYILDTSIKVKSMVRAVENSNLGTYTPGNGKMEEVQVRGAFSSQMVDVTRVKCGIVSHTGSVS